MKITNANTADCTIRTADDMNYGWGAFKRGAANSKRARERGEKKIEVPNTSQKKKTTDSWEIQGWRALKYAYHLILHSISNNGNAEAAKKAAVAAANLAPG